MANLYETLADAQHGEAIAELGREFGLTSQQTEAAVAALLPAISVGLKRATATPEGLGELFSVMGRQPDIYSLYQDPKAAFSSEGRAAGNEVLAKMFGSPDASRAIADHAQQLSGVTSVILKKLLPVIVGILISGLMRSGSGKATPSAPEPSPEEGGGALIDILRQIFGGQGMRSPTAPPTRPAPIPTTAPKRGGKIGDKLGPGRGYQVPEEDGEGQNEDPTGTDAPTIPGDDPMSQILRELEKALREGRVKGVVVGPTKIEIPGGSGQAGEPQSPGGDILGQILRDLLGGGSGQLPKQGLGAALFGDRLEAGQTIEQRQLDAFQQLLDRFAGPR